MTSSKKYTFSLGFSSTKWVSEEYWMAWNKINVFSQIAVGNNGDEDNFDEEMMKTNIYIYIKRQRYTETERQRDSKKDTEK